MKHLRTIVSICLVATLLSACEFTNTIERLLASPTPTATATSTSTLTPTATNTSTPTNTATVTSTFTLTPSPTVTPKPKPTKTTVPSGGTGGTCDGGNTAIEAAILSAINTVRANNGVAALQSNGSLTSVAREYSKEMALNNTTGHGDFTTRIYGAGSFSAIGENIAYGYDTAWGVVNAWMGSEGHRANLLNSTYNKAGVGYWCNPNSTYGDYVTLDLAR